jgi:RHS repeat-associated protein
VHAYDALGRRVRTMVEAYVGGQWTAFSTTERDFLGRLPLGIETSFVGGSAKSWRFLRGPDASGTLEGAGGARGVLAVLKDASSWKAVAADTLGNVLALAGINGDFQRRTFDPWGNPLTRDAAGNLRASTLQERRADYDALPLAWASQEVDPDTGLTHYHFREYSPSLGGWLTRDPIGLAGGYLNLRSYLGNRPMDELDVWGEQMGYPPQPSDVKVTEVDAGDSRLHGEERAYFSQKGGLDDSDFSYGKDGSMTAPTATYDIEIFIAKGKRSEKDEAGNTMEEHEKLHARYFYEAYKGIADELNKFETDKTNCPSKCRVLAKAYVASVLGYYKMRLAYQNAELHNRTYSYESLRKEYKAPDEERFPRHLQEMVARGGDPGVLYLDELRRHHKDKILDDYTDKIGQLDGQKQQALAKLKECLAK